MRHLNILVFKAMERQETQVIAVLHGRSVLVPLITTISAGARRPLQRTRMQTQFDGAPFTISVSIPSGPQVMLDWQRSASSKRVHQLRSKLHILV